LYPFAITDSNLGGNRFISSELKGVDDNES